MNYGGESHAIYAYDVKSQMQEPVFVVYDPDDVRPVAKALDLEVDDLFITREATHPFHHSPYRPSSPTYTGKRTEWKPIAQKATREAEDLKKRVKNRDEQIATLNQQLNKELRNVNAALAHVKRLQEELKTMNCTAPVEYNGMIRCS
jgi:hypothetical protein